MKEAVLAKPDTLSLIVSIPRSSLHCTSNYYIEPNGNLVDFVTSIGSNQDDASKCDVDQEAYKIELCTGFKATNGEYLYEGDIVEMPLGIKTTWIQLHGCLGISSSTNTGHRLRWPT